MLQVFIGFVLLDLLGCVVIVYLTVRFRCGIHKVWSLVFVFQVRVL